MDTAEIEDAVTLATEPEQQANGLPEEASEAAAAPASKEGQHEEDDEPWRRR